jgi:hypothetical protein
MMQMWAVAGIILETTGQQILLAVHLENCNVLNRGIREVPLNGEPWDKWEHQSGAGQKV